MLIVMNEQRGSFARRADLVENVRRQQLEWVRATMEHFHWNPTRLAREAGMSQSTLSKWLNDPKNIARLQTDSVEKLKRISPFPPYETSLPAAVRGVSSTEEAVQVAEMAGQAGTSLELPQLARQVADLLSERGAGRIQRWILRSRALEAAGYLPGDLLLVDTDAEPEEGDVVMASLDDRFGEGSLIFRIYEAPYLQAATLQRGLFKPLLIDGNRVVVSGVVVLSLRPRLSDLPDIVELPALAS